MHKKYLLELSVFICGMAVMIYELIGTRILAPYLGTSIYVWTSIIGVILASLSLGYMYGGRVADKNSNLRTFSNLIFISGLIICFTVLIKEIFLIFLSQELILGIRAKSVLSSIILFAPASFILGMISPYAVKLKIKTLDTTGVAVGNLYAISTFGSIFGTFITGFYLIPAIGTTNILIIVSLILVLLSYILHFKKFKLIKTAVLLIIFSFFIFHFFFHSVSAKLGLIDVDTAYQRVWILDYNDDLQNKKVRALLTGPHDSQSRMFLDNSNELTDDYQKYFTLASHFYPNFNKTLLIGGGAYTFPKYFLQEYKNAQIDVVEIDEKLTELAKKHFNLKENKNLNIVHEDARIFLNKSTSYYDIIYKDAFHSYAAIPYHLTTAEFVTEEYNHLTDNGIVLVNMISALQGERSYFLQAIYLTYKSIFPHVYLFPVNKSLESAYVQNIVLLALKSNETPIFSSPNEETNELLSHRLTNEPEIKVPILTDDFAPVEYYHIKKL